MNWLRFFFGVFVFAVVIFGGLCGIMLVSWSDLSGNERFLAVSGVVLFVVGLVVSIVFRGVSFVREGQVFEPVPSVPDAELIGLREDLERSRDKPVVVEPPIVQPTKGFRSISDDVSMYEDDEPEPDNNRNILKPPLQQDYNRKGDDEYSGVF